MSDSWKNKLLLISGVILLFSVLQSAGLLKFTEDRVTLRKLQPDGGYVTLKTNMPYSNCVKERQKYIDLGLPAECVR